MRPSGAAIKTHRTSMFQKSTIQPRSSVGKKLRVMGRWDIGTSCNDLLGKWEKPVQKMQPAVRANEPTRRRSRKGRYADEWSCIKRYTVTQNSTAIVTESQPVALS